ncbi:hypothetical protein CVN76_17620 [Bacillus sp. mrc49]|nr:hypothetical protein CVN76_17620 [Bacillus sp. mrc49]
MTVTFELRYNPDCPQLEGCACDISISSKGFLSAAVPEPRTFTMREPIILKALFISCVKYKWLLH